MDERAESSEKRKYTVGDADPAVREYLLDLDDEHSRNTAQLAVQHDENIISLKSRLAFFDKYIHQLNLELDGYLRRQYSSGQQPASPVSGVICYITDKKYSFTSVQSIINDGLGIVASLGKVVGDDNLSSMLSEYLGKETMLALVFKTPSGVRAVEYSDKDGGAVDFGVHGLTEGRFLVYCLRLLRPFAGSVHPGDPQRRLELMEPRLPGGKPPQGFLGFAVNMIYLDEEHLTGVTSDGRGLRETLFYTLFSRLQVYATRKDMIEAMPYISTDDAVSLDGGIIKWDGVRFVHWERCDDSEIRFPVITGNRPPFQPVKVVEIEQMIKFNEWKKELVVSEIQSEEAKINEIKSVLKAKAEVYKKLIAEEIESRRRR